MSDSFSDEIMKAIGAHGVWKVRLRAAAQMDKPLLEPETIAAPDRCAFAQWLQTVGAKALTPTQFANIHKLHADFHRAAGAVARDVMAGARDKALAEIDSGEFNRISTEMKLSLDRIRKGM